MTTAINFCNISETRNQKLAVAQTEETTINNNCYPIFIYHSHSFISTTDKKQLCNRAKIK